MKKILSLLLVLSLVLGSFSFAFAAEDTTVEPGEVLKALNLVKGDGEDLMLDQELKREDMVVLLSRLYDQEDVAANFNLDPSFEDITNDFYAPYLAWGQANGYFNGHSSEEFGFGETITVKQMQTLMLRVLGYTDEAADYENVPTYAAILGLMGDLQVDPSEDLERGKMASMVFTALNMPLNGSDKTLAEELNKAEELAELTGEPVEEEPEVVEEFTFEQAGAKKLTVTFNTEVDTEEVEFDLNRGKVNANIKDVEWNEENTVATLSTYTNLRSDEYTVTIEGVELEEATATIEAEKSEVSSIEIKSHTAILKADSDTEATVGYEVLNQFGESVTDTVDWSTSAKSVSASNGTLTIKADSTFDVDDVVVVNAIHTSTGTYMSEKLTVAKAANIETLELIEVKNIGDADDNVMNASDNGSDYEWVIEYEAYDQYGNEVTDLTGVNFTPADGETAKENKLVTDEKDSDGNDLIKIDPKAAETFVVSAVVPSTGAYDTITVEVEAIASIDTFTFSLPEEELYVGEAIELPYEAYDQYGEEVTSLASLEDAVDIDSTNNSDIGWVEDPITGDVTLEYIPAEEGTDILTTLVGTDYIKVTADVNEAAVPTTIEGIAEDTVTNVVYNASTTLGAGDFVIRDQYGREDTLGDYTIVVEDADEVGTDVDADNNFAFDGKSSAGESTFTAYLEDADKDKVDESTFAFNLVTVDKEDIVEYELADIETIYAGSVVNSVYADETDYAVGIDVYGLDSDDVKVALADEDVKYTKFVDGTYVEDKDGKVQPAKVLDSAEDDTEDTIVVAVKSNDGLVILRDSFDITNAAPKAESIEVKLADDATEGTDYEAFNSDDNVLAIKAEDLNDFESVVDFVVTDQYGVTKSLDADFYFLDTEIVSIDDNGDLTDSSAEAGDEFTVTAMTDNGLEASVKVLVK